MDKYVHYVLFSLLLESNTAVMHDESECLQE